ncbi:hypothetical protein, partial [Microbacterium sp.]|uniref:hypothetical protein n=1 Tax=Microbacterium sp. TaxID=51671 RepID=UPI0026365DE0
MRNTQDHEGEDMSEVTAESKGAPNTSLLIRGAIWIAIGALIAAALVCVVWVLIGDQDGLIARAFLTIVLLAGFAGIAILEAGLATRRPDWLALASMITWIVALIVGAIKIWLPEEPGEYASGFVRFIQLLLVVAILQLALLHVRLFTAAARRYVTTFTTIIYYVTIAILVLLVGMLVFFLTLPEVFDYSDIYWRIVVALAILAAVGTTLIPLLNALFAPKAPAPAAAPGYSAQSYASGAAVAAPLAQQWPTYADGVTPLPVLQDGLPDWNAYYTGYPTQPQAYQAGYGQLPALPGEHSAADANAYGAPAADPNSYGTPAADPNGYAAPVADAPTSSPDAPIAPDGSAVPPAGAPPAPDGVPGEQMTDAAPPIPPAPEYATPEYAAPEQASPAQAPPVQAPPAQDPPVQAPPAQTAPGQEPP